MKTPILGATYVARSVNAANSRMVNLFPEVTPEGGKERGFLTRAPGLRRLATVGSGPIRGMWSFGGAGYVASGNSLYRINTAYSPTLLGPISGTGPVSMADNGFQLFTACNGPSYIYNRITNSFVQITDPDFPGAKTVGFLDQFFVFNEPNSQRVWTTAILEGTDIDALDFASAEGDPDDLVGLIVDHREAWLFGTKTVEVWYTVGGTGFPLARIQGAFNEIGCAAPYSICKMDNGLFWLGSDARGYGMVYRANGYKGDRISNHGMEWQIQQYGNISDAIGYTYQQEGHSFYVLTFPSADATWCYDVSTNAWHERAGWNTPAGVFTRHRSNCQMFFNNTNIVGDFENGNIYALDTNVYDDDGEIQKWLRSWRALPPGRNDLKETLHHSLQLDIESGVGLVSGQGVDPEIILRWSDDAGHNWNSGRQLKMGRLGEYGNRIITRRLGATNKLRDRVYEISGTDPVKVSIMGAELIMSNTNA